MDALVGEAVDRARTAALAKDIELQAGGSPDALVWGDADLLVTALRNLIDNAIAYSEPGTQVGVGTTVRDGAVEIAVVDQGIGIAAAGPASAVRALLPRRPGPVPGHRRHRARA